MRRTSRAADLFNSAAEMVTGTAAADVLARTNASSPGHEAAVAMEGDRRILESGAAATYESRSPSPAARSRRSSAPRDPSTTRPGTCSACSASPRHHGAQRNRAKTEPQRGASASDPRVDGGRHPRGRHRRRHLQGQPPVRRDVADPAIRSWRATTWRRPSSSPSSNWRIRRRSSKSADAHGVRQDVVETLRLRNGRVFERHTAPIIEEAGVVGGVWSFSDVTAKTEARTELRERERALDGPSSPTCRYGDPLRERPLLDHGVRQRRTQELTGHVPEALVGSAAVSMPTSCSPTTSSDSGTPSRPRSPPTRRGRRPIASPPPTAPSSGRGSAAFPPSRRTTR